ncbi:S-methyl-5-thioribose-1-phosphate isomerase [candidate division WOR-3 bacterium]|nr:S-methyl-5-thioribose-1-phosphate isomerase [candidate division WOR-3 bacterium]
MKKKVLNLLRAAIYEEGTLLLLDQTRLPHQERYLRLRRASEVARAIKLLQVRGAPWIGVAAAYGLALEAQRLSDDRLRAGLRKAAQVLIKARPTAVNLSWAVNRITALIQQANLTPARLRRAVIAEAKAIEQEEQKRSHLMALAGVKVVPQNAVVLTICNTGSLAAPGLGTALGVVFQAHQAGKKVEVYVCETRPLLQGARLTAFELLRAKVPFYLIADSAAASVIERCDLVLVGADRIAGNGDTANKIGTRMLAVLAKEAKKPFYVVAPVSTFDLQCRSGADIVIEERSGDEVRRFGRCRVAPQQVRVFNPAFDVTPARLITAFITDAGIIKPPFKRNIRRVLFG